MPQSISKDMAGRSSTARSGAGFGWRTFALVLAGALSSQAQAEPFAYIANESSNTVSVIDVATRQVSATVMVEKSPYGVATHPDGSRVYVANQLSNTVSVINTANNTVITSIPVGNTPIGVAVNPAGTKAYVANQLGDTVSVVDTATNTVLGTVTVGEMPIAFGISPSGDRVYVSNYKDSTISVIDGSTDQLLYTARYVFEPGGIAVHPLADVVYVTSSGSHQVTVFDASVSPMRAITRVAVGIVPTDMALTPSGQQLYVTNSNDNNVSILDLSDPKAPTFSKKVPVGTFPRGVAVHPDGSQVYVSNVNSSNVSVIDTVTKEVVGTVTVGLHPSSHGNFITNNTLRLVPIKLPPTAVDQPLSQALKAFGCKAPCTWSLNGAPSWLQIDSQTGVLSGTPDAPAPAGAPLSFTATVTDNSTPTPSSDSKTLSLTVSPKLVNTTPALPGGTVGVAYSAALTATGGTTPYQWTAASLPPGLSITGSGSNWVLSGTPTQEGSYTVTPELSDSGTSNAQTAPSQAHTVVIAPAPIVVPPLVITTTGSLPEAGEGQGYSQQLRVTGGTAPYSWSVVTGSLPPGLTLDATGLLSGTVPKAALLAGQAKQATKVAGSFSFDVQVTDSSPQPQSATQQLSLQVTAAQVVPPAPTPAPTPVPSLGTWALVLLNLAAAVMGGLAWRWRRMRLQA